MFDPKINLLFPILALSVIPISLKNASANLLGAYNPPPPEKIDVRRSLGSGSRSNCPSSWEKNSLILLVPEAETVNYTASNSPSFYFYARESSTVPLIFNLVDPEPNADNPLVEQNLLVNNSGIQKVELPKQVKLEMGKVYLWQLGIRCGDNPEQIAQVIKAAVKQIRLPSQTTSQLQTIRSRNRSGGMESAMRSATET